MSLWAVTAFFNPAGYRSRLGNYRCFRRQLRVPLLTVEWSETGAFQLGDDEADRLLRLSGGDLMWQKERLLGIAARHLPDDCEAVLLIDADILLPGDSWPERLRELLPFHPVVQPFREVHHLAPVTPAEGSGPDDLGSAPHQPGFYLARQSFADHVLHGIQPTAAPTVMLNASPEQQQEVKRLTARPSFGHAWAVRRDWLERVGLYEHAVAGSGDLAFAMAIAGRAEEFCRTYPLNGAQQSHYLRWAACAAQEAGPGRISRLDDTAVHLFHGHLNRRSYRSRLEVLAASGFDPGRDLTAAPGDPFTWVASSPPTESLRGFFKTYFRHRAEDGNQNPLQGQGHG
jgi:hypothetical protein